MKIRTYIPLPQFDAQLDRNALMPFLMKVHAAGFNCTEYTLRTNYDTKRSYLEVVSLIWDTVNLKARRSALAKSLGVRFVGRPPRAGELCGL